MSVPLVVKLGGSYAGSAARAAWLAAIGTAGGRAVLVPGGGPFADAVRAAQSAMGFDDRAAHDMALMAMGQYGTALAATAPGLAPADSLAEIEAVLAAGGVPVWRPWPMLRDAPEIEPGWDVTSDSLALWLATRLRAAALLLVKQVTEAPDLTDTAFNRYRSRFGGEVLVAGPDEAPDALDPARPPGRVLAAAALA